MIRRPHSDGRRHERKHALYATALVCLLGLAGCGGGGGSGASSIAVQPARQYTLQFKATPGTPTHVTLRIVQPDGKPLTKYKRGSGPHTGVHVIYVRRDLAVLVHHHPHIAQDGTIRDTVDFPLPGPYRVEVDVYPAQQSPQPNFQLTAAVTAPGPYAARPLPAPTTTQTVDGYRFSVTGLEKLHAISPAFLTVRVRTPGGKPATFTPWFGALAHAIFFRSGSLDYFHTHVCAPGASGCTSTFGAAKVTGTSSTPGKLNVGVLVPTPGTWRLFLQCQVDGRIVTAPFTLKVS